MGNRLSRVMGAAMVLSTAIVLGVVGAWNGTAAASSAKSYTVMVEGGLTGPASYTVPEIVPAVKAAYRGVSGVKIISCDDQFSSADDLNCQEAAVTDHVSVVIAGFGLLSEDESILTKAGIPVIDDTDTTSPNSFAVNSNNGEYSGIGVGLAKAGCHRLGILLIDGTSTLASAIVAGAKWQSVTEAPVPANAPDLTPSVAKLAGAKVQCIAVSLEPNAVLQAMIAIKQDKLKVKVAMVSAVLTPQVLSSLGSEANGIIAIEGEVDPTAQVPVVATIKKEMKAVDPSAPVTAAAIAAWASAKLVIDAAPTIRGAVTASSMMKALNHLRNASTDGAIPPFSAIPLKNPAYARYFNHYDIDYVIENGHLKPLTGFYNVESALGT
jgi:Periplasmic binding protein